MTLRNRSKPYSNIENGLLKGTSSTNQATVPKGRLLIIEYVSGFIFRPPSSALNSETTMAVTDPALGLNGAGFHIFPAVRVNSTPQNDVSAPLKMMLHPGASAGRPRGVWISGEVQGRRIALFPFARSMTTTRPCGRGMTWIVVT